MRLELDGVRFRGACSFNPLLGILTIAPSADVTELLVLAQFQSPTRDSDHCANFVIASPVPLQRRFNPLLGILTIAPLRSGPHREGSSSGFNPLLGILTIAPKMNRLGLNNALVFQSPTRDSDHCASNWTAFGSGALAVSIPYSGF